MTITIPPDIEASILAAVRSGRFASVDDAIIEAARLLVRELNHSQPVPPTPPDIEAPDPLLGLMREDAGLMDEIVADAYRQRREGTWREVDL